MSIQLKVDRVKKILECVNSIKSSLIKKKKREKEVNRLLADLAFFGYLQ